MSQRDSFMFNQKFAAHQKPIAMFLLTDVTKSYYSCFYSCLYLKKGLISKADVVYHSHFTYSLGLMLRYCKVANKQ